MSRDYLCTTIKMDLDDAEGEWEVYLHVRGYNSDSQGVVVTEASIDGREAVLVTEDLTDFVADALVKGDWDEDAAYEAADGAYFAAVGL